MIIFLVQNKSSHFHYVIPKSYSLTYIMYVLHTLHIYLLLHIDTSGTDFPYRILYSKNKSDNTNVTDKHASLYTYVHTHNFFKPTDQSC